MKKGCKCRKGGVYKSREGADLRVTPTTLELRTEAAAGGLVGVGGGACVWGQRRRGGEEPVRGERGPLRGGRGESLGGMWARNWSIENKRGKKITH